MEGIHPLDVALEATGITQAQLSAMVDGLKRRRKSGRPLTLAQSTISQICNFERGTSPEVAEAIVDVLKGMIDITAAEIVFAKRPKQHAVAKPKKTKPRVRAA
jgi:Lhr-like helicase